jgi:very-short-patch-repair endonuclease
LKKLKDDVLRSRRADRRPPEPFGSWFELDVFFRISDKGFRVIPQYESAGYFIDMVIEGISGRLAVECDGDQWHGPEQYDSDMKRQRILERCGQKFWRIRGSEYYSNPDAAMSSLWSLLEDLEIYPLKNDVIVEESFRDAVQSENSKETIFESNSIQMIIEEGTKIGDNSSGSIRSDYLNAVLSVLPREGKMLRPDVIKAAAKLLRDQERIDFERLRENGEIWSKFKTAIHSGIRRGLVDGDNRYLWRIEKQSLGGIVGIDS